MYTSLGGEGYIATLQNSPLPISSFSKLAIGGFGFGTEGDGEKRHKTACRDKSSDVRPWGF